MPSPPAGLVRAPDHMQQSAAPMDAKQSAVLRRMEEKQQERHLGKKAEQLTTLRAGLPTAMARLERVGHIKGEANTHFTAGKVGPAMQARALSQAASRSIPRSGAVCRAPSRVSGF